MKKVLSIYSANTCWDPNVKPSFDVPSRKVTARKEIEGYRREKRSLRASWGIKPEGLRPP